MGKQAQKGFGDLPRLSGQLVVCDLHGCLSLPHPLSSPALPRKPSSTKSKSSQGRGLLSSHALLSQASCTTRQLPLENHLTSLGLDFLISEIGMIISALQSHCCINETQKWFPWYKVPHTPEGDLTQPFAPTHLCITLRGSGSACLSLFLPSPALSGSGLDLLLTSTAQLALLSDPSSPSILSTRAPQRQSLANLL